MSFGDLPRTPISSRPTPACELEGSLNALAANNAALRRTSQRLREQEPVSRPQLNRVRELREQNRDIARAAGQFAARVNDSRAVAKFHTLVDDFSRALRESVQAESDALAAATGDGMREVDVALAEAGGGGESEPLLGGGGRGGGLVYTTEEEAVLREIRGNEAFVRERNAVLSEVQSSVDDVNSIFKDLAVMVGDQGAHVDYVEVAVGDTAENVVKARRELVKTQRRREGRRSFFFCTLLSIAGIIAVFLVVLLR